MARNQSFNSPLSRIEQEAARQKHGNSNVNNKNKRLSIVSNVSIDSVSTTGRLLDKLKLADSEWDDSEKSVISLPLNDPDTSIGSINTLNSETSIKPNTSSHSDVTASANSSFNVLSASKFKYLKSVLGDTKRKNSQKSAVNKAMEMGKKINTVEQNVSHVVHRASVKSIHLDSLLRDADSSISSFESQSETEDDDDMVERFINNTYSDPITINEQDDAELSFVPNTPTRAVFDATPSNSPETYVGTPGYSIESTPKTYMRSYHNHTHSTLSNASFRADSINESFLVKNRSDDEIPRFSNHSRNHSGNNLHRTIPPQLPESFQPYHQHAQSVATADCTVGSVDSDMAKNINETLMRSASVPIKRNPSVKQTPAPNSPLPIPPATMRQPSTFQEQQQQQPHVPMPSYNNFYNQTSPHMNQTDHFKNYHPLPQSQSDYYHQQSTQPVYQQQQQQQQQQHHTVPQYYQPPQQQPMSSQPQQLYYHNGSNNNAYAKRGMTSPSSNQFHFVQSPQTYQQRNFNPPLYSGGLPPHSRAANQQKAMHQTQQLLYPQQQYPTNNNNTNNYKNPQRYGNFSPQASPNVGHFNIVANNNTNNNSYGNYPSYGYSDFDGYNTPSTPPSHTKKNNKFQNVDLSHIMPR